jgi:hypothetical protein
VGSNKQHRHTLVRPQPRLHSTQLKSCAMHSSRRTKQTNATHDLGCQMTPAPRREEHASHTKAPLKPNSSTSIASAMPCPCYARGQMKVKSQPAATTTTVGDHQRACSAASARASELAVRVSSGLKPAAQPSPPLPPPQSRSLAGRERSASRNPAGDMPRCCCCCCCSACGVPPLQCATRARASGGGEEGTPLGGWGAPCVDIVRCTPPSSRSSRPGAVDGETARTGWDQFLPPRRPPAESGTNSSTSASQVNWRKSDDVCAEARCY